jgi:histidinol dehydrogenase
LEGPSEIVILADGTAPANAVAADLVAQAEHAGDNFCALITPSRPLVLKVLEEVLRQLRSLPRSRQAATSISSLGIVGLVKSMREGLAWTNRIAPEHVEIIGRGADRLAAGIRHAGTVLVGPASPVAAADYGVGPNHVLPTSGTARYASGLGVKDFVKTMNVTRLNTAGLRRLAPHLARIARLEGLEGHARSMEMNRG